MSSSSDEEEIDSLDAIDRDLKEIVKLCKSSGQSADEVAKEASPILAMASKNSSDSESVSSSGLGFREWKKGVFATAAAVVITAFLFQNTWTFRWMCIAGKTFEMKILPFWDWTTLYQEGCILNNPYVASTKLTEDDCQSCTNFDKVEVVQNVSMDEVTNDYLFDNIPFVVTDASQDWRAFKEFSLDSLKKLYTTDKVLSSHDVCEYRDVYGQNLADILSEDHSFHASWVNCETPGIKAFRSYYHRPYFLPPMVESASENFVAVSTGLLDSSSEDNQFEEYLSSSDLTWFAQIRGSYKIQLRPKAPCDDICQMFEVVLQEGDTIVLTNEMWELWFIPSSNQPTIAIGSTGNWNS